MADFRKIRTLDQIYQLCRDYEGDEIEVVEALTGVLFDEETALNLKRQIKISDEVEAELMFDDEEVINE